MCRQHRDVEYSPSSNWGLRTGPAITTAIAADPDDGDTVFSDGDTLTLHFDMPTDMPLASTQPLAKAAVDSLLSFSPAIGRDYTGAW